MKEKMLGYVRLTLVKSGCDVFVRANRICSFYRKEDSDYTSVYISGNTDFFMVKELPEEIMHELTEVHPDLR